MYYHYTTLPFPLFYTIKRRRALGALLAFGVNGVLLAKTAVFGELKLFFHFAFVTLRVVGNSLTERTLELDHVVFDDSHNV